MDIPSLLRAATARPLQRYLRKTVFITTSFHVAGRPRLGAHVGRDILHRLCEELKAYMKGSPEMPNAARGGRPGVVTDHALHAGCLWQVHVHGLWGQHQNREISRFVMGHQLRVKAKLREEHQRAIAESGGDCGLGGQDDIGGITLRPP